MNKKKLERAAAKIEADIAAFFKMAQEAANENNSLVTISLGDRRYHYEPKGVFKGKTYDEIDEMYNNVAEITVEHDEPAGWQSSTICY